MASDHPRVATDARGMSMARTLETIRTAQIDHRR
jgi:hypothetical protein